MQGGSTPCLVVKLSGQNFDDVGLRKSSVVELSMGYVQVPEEGEGAEVKAPLLMTQGCQH